MHGEWDRKAGAVSVIFGRITVVACYISPNDLTKEEFQPLYEEIRSHISTYVPAQRIWRRECMARRYWRRKSLSDWTGISKWKWTAAGIMNEDDITNSSNNNEEVLL